MCGIAFLLLHHPFSCTTTNTSSEKCLASLQATIAPRGPDGQDSLTLSITPTLSLTLLASVLHMRGAQFCPQPIQDAEGNVLLWNGEIFGGQFFDAQRNKTPGPGEMDTVAVLEALGGGAWQQRQQQEEEEEENENDDSISISQHIQRTMANIQGPWAMVYYHKATQTVHFGRDKLGRRSLVLKTSHCENDAGEGEEGGWLAVASASAPGVGIREEKDKKGHGDGWEEVKVQGLWCLNLMDPLSSSYMTPRLVPWLQEGQQPQQQEEEARQDCHSLEKASELLLEKLATAVQRRVALLPAPPLQATTKEEQNEREVGPPARISILYSGGLDCQVLAVLTHQHLCKEEKEGGQAEEGNHNHKYAPIDLINVCFDQGRHQSPDRLGALAGWRELRKLYPSRLWRLLLVDVDYAQVKEVEEKVKELIKPCYTPMDFNIACAFYFAARGVGRVALPEEAERVPGKDCTGLLRYGKEVKEDREGEEEQQQQQQVVAAVPGGCPVEGCRRVPKPGCLRGMCGRCCLKIIKEETLASINTTHTHTPCRVHKLKKKYLAQAASTSSLHSGAGASSLPPPSSHSPLPSPPPPPPPPSMPLYRSHARVVLFGIGADEQLAGYGRHRSTFRRGGEAALEAELAMDLGRLWTRNLGRDDRVIAAHGREARFPYLDEDVMSFLRSLPMHHKFCLAEPRGVGDKKILRYLAREWLGLEGAAALVKRAIQFGSRIAKEANTHNFGSHRAGKQPRWERKGKRGGKGVEEGEEEEEEEVGEAGEGERKSVYKTCVDEF